MNTPKVHNITQGRRKLLGSGEAVKAPASPLLFFLTTVYLLFPAARCDIFKIVQSFNTLLQ